MAEVPVRELRNHGGEIIDRVAGGERVVITRSGRPVAELRPVQRQPLNAEALLRRWRHLPAVDPRRLRADVDDVIDSGL